MPFVDFSLQNLYTALDAQRQARGLTWAQVTREMNGPPEQVRGHALSTSTVTGTRIRSVAEADGVLQMLRWLNRSPESFLPGFSAFANAEAGFPVVGQYQVLRFNTRQIYEALDARRKERNLTWTQVGKELGLSAPSLRHLEKGGRTSFPSVMRITGWLGRRAAEFTHAVGGAH